MTTFAGKRYGLSFYIDAVLVQHLVYEIERAEARRFRTQDRTAIFQPFAREGTRMFAFQLLVHAENITDFASAYADIARRYIRIGTHVAPQLQHESLTETHDFRIALATRGKIGTALRAAHGQRRQRVLKRLLKP